MARDVPMDRPPKSFRNGRGGGLQFKGGTSGGQILQNCDKKCCNACVRLTACGMGRYYIVPIHKAFAASGSCQPWKRMQTGGSPPLLVIKELPELRALRPRADGVVAQVEAQLLQTGYLVQAVGEVLAACVASGRRERHANFRGKQNSRSKRHSGCFSDAPGFRMVIRGCFGCNNWTTRRPRTGPPAPNPLQALSALSCRPFRVSEPMRPSAV